MIQGGSLRVLRNLRRRYKGKLFFLDITLALHRKGRDAVTGNLSKQGAGHLLDAEGKADMFDRTLVSKIGQHI